MTIESRLQELSNQGLAAFKRKQYVQALDAFGELRRLSPSDESAVYFTALTLFRLDEGDKAVPHLRKLATESKNGFYRLQGHLLLAYQHSLRSRFEESDKELQALLGENFENPQVYSISGYNAYRRKDWAQAEYYYRKALSLDPDNANAHNGLACTYLEWEGRDDKALPHLETALRLAPGTPAYLDSIGWFHFLKRQVSKALFYLQKALRLRPHPEIASHIKAVKADALLMNRPEAKFPEPPKGAKPAPGKAPA